MSTTLPDGPRWFVAGDLDGLLGLPRRTKPELGIIAISRWIVIPPGDGCLKGGTALENEVHLQR